MEGTSQKQWKTLLQSIDNHGRSICFFGRRWLSSLQSHDYFEFQQALQSLAINCKDGIEKCLICYNTSRNKAHASKDCTILKQIGYKLIKRSSNTDAASCIGSDGNTTPTVQPPASTPVPMPSDGSGLGFAPRAFTAHQKWFYAPYYGV